MCICTKLKQINLLIPKSTLSSNKYRSKIKKRSLRSEQGTIGFLNSYVDYGIAHSSYNDWFLKIFYEKYAKRNKHSIWI